MSLKEVSEIRETLSLHLNNVTNLNSAVQELSVLLVGDHSRNERTIKQLKEEKEKNEKCLEVLKGSLENSVTTFKSLLHDGKVFEKELDEIQKSLFKLFQWVWMPFVNFFKIRSIQKSINVWNKKMLAILEEIDDYQQEILKKLIKNCAYEICLYLVQVQQLQFREKQKVTNNLLKLLNTHLDFLTTLEPLFERVERNIGFNENALRNAIEDLKNYIQATFADAIKDEGDKG